MKSRAGNVFVTVAVLALTGIALGPVAAPVWAPMQARNPGWRLNPGPVDAVQGMVGALLGGFRAAAADVAWLEMCDAAEAHDLPAAQSWLDAVKVIDPRPLYFWLNGARIMAYDMPTWRIEAEGGGSRVPAAVQRRLVEEQARWAIRRLEEARAFHPASAALWIEQANIELNRLGDLEGAAESYRRAWEQPHAPYYAARLHAELLRRLGRKAEALAWLVRLHPLLPPADESAGAELVLSRIRQLERELGVPAGQGYGQRLWRGSDLP